MKRKTAVVLAVLGALLPLLVLGVVIYGQITPVRVSDLDREVLRRTEAQLQALQLRLQTEAAPIIGEHDAVYKKYCDKAGLTIGVGGNCQINTLTGEVTKIPPQPTKK